MRVLLFGSGTLSWPRWMPLQISVIGCFLYSDLIKMDLFIGRRSEVTLARSSNCIQHSARFRLILLKNSASEWVESLSWWWLLESFIKPVEVGYYDGA